MVRPRVVNPAKLGIPIGYANGMRAGEFLFVAGQIGSDVLPDGRHVLVSRDFAEQFERAVANVLEVVRAAGGRPESLVEMVVFVKDMKTYRSARKALGARWQRQMGRHYPAMTLVEVNDLFEAGALVEIRAVAYLG